MADVRGWTVLAYIVADDTGVPPDPIRALIDQVAREEVSNMVKAASGRDGMYLAVQVDYTRPNGVDRIIVPDGKVEHLDESPAGPTDLKTFLKIVKERCPAHRYMMIVWGHGAGPLGFFSDGNGTVGKSTQIGRLSLRQLRGVLETACAAYSKSSMDILIAKSCYMATAETAWELQSAADFLICSQAKVPVRTWTIWDVFSELNDDDSTEVIAKRVLLALGRHYDAAVERSRRREIPFTLIRPGAVVGLAYDTRRIVELLRGSYADEAVMSAVERARPMRAGDEALLDIPTLCWNLKRFPAFRANAANLEEIVRNAVVVDHLPVDSHFGGLGVFHMPRNALLRRESFANDVSSGQYRTLGFAAETNWDAVAFPS